MTWKIVNKVILGLLVMAPFSLEAKKGTWPGVEYSYVRCFLYNTDNILYGQHAPVKGGSLDSTIIGQGFMLDSIETEKILNLANKKNKGLLIGLAECYIPHHAFIFFNSNHEPVAYMSFCKDCEAIRVWPNIHCKHHELSKKEITEAENDAKMLSDIISSNGIVVGETPEDYRIYSKPKWGLNEMVTDDGYLLLAMDSLFSRTLGSDLIQDYIKLYPNPDSLEIKNNIKITAGGDEFNFKEVIRDKDISSFEGEDPNCRLYDAKIQSEDFVTKNGIYVGQSFEELMIVLKNTRKLREMIMAHYNGILIHDNHSIFVLRISLEYGRIKSLQFINI